jgi:Tfp pilus assembly protein PilW
MMLPSRPRSLARSRARRGYSLVELVVVAAAFTAISVLLLSWLTSLFAVTGTSAVTNVVQRNAAYTLNYLADDLRSARACDPYGADTSLVSVDAARLTFNADPAASGTPVTVAWRYFEGAMQRTQVTGCNADLTGATWTTMVAADTVGTAAVFEVLGTDGTSTSNVTCSTWAQGPCWMRVVTVRFAQVTPEGATVERYASIAVPR